MREADIEGYLIKQAYARGGRAFKFVSPGCTGVPDRIVVLPGGRVGFLELKAPGEKVRRDQEVRIKQLRDLGCHADCADAHGAVDAFLDRLQAGGAS